MSKRFVNSLEILELLNATLSLTNLTDNKPVMLWFFLKAILKQKELEKVLTESMLEFGMLMYTFLMDKNESFDSEMKENDGKFFEVLD